MIKFEEQTINLHNITIDLIDFNIINDMIKSLMERIYNRDKEKGKDYVYEKIKSIDIILLNKDNIINDDIIYSLIIYYTVKDIKSNESHEYIHIYDSTYPASFVKNSIL